MATMQKSIPKTHPPLKKKGPRPTTKPAPLAAAARSRAPATRPHAPPPPSLQSVKLMPFDFRFTAGSPEERALNDECSDNLDDAAKEEMHVKSNDGFEVNDDSPYSLKVSGGEISTTVMVDLSKQVEARWSDTTTFNAKKEEAKIWKEPRGKRKRECNRETKRMKLDVGFMFNDITTLLLHPKTFKDVVEIFVDRYRDMDISAVAACSC